MDCFDCAMTVSVQGYFRGTDLQKERNLGVLRSTVRLRFRKSISGHNFQTIGKLASNDFDYHT